jgi:predicted RNA-binding protein
LDTVGEGGFSLKVFSRHSSNNSFSLMNRTGGRETIYFPSYLKLQKYIDDKKSVDKYANLLVSLGCSDIKYLRETQRTSLSINTVENNMNEICAVINQILS